MEIKVTITAEPALMSLLENLGKSLLVFGNDLASTSESYTARDAAEREFTLQMANPTPARSIPGQAPALTAPTSPAPSTPMAPVTPPLAPSIPINPAPYAPPVSSIPTSAPSYSIDQLSVAATGLVDAGKVGDLMALLGQYGCQALTQLPDERYGEFATAMRGLGAQI